MISKLEFLFPSGIPDPSSPQYRQMIAEIGREGRWLEWLFLIIALLCMIPVALFVGGAVWELIRRSRVSAEVFIGLIFLVLGCIFFAVYHYHEKPRRPYRLAAEEYSRYKVVEARITKLGMVTKQRPSYDQYRRVRWKSEPPLAREEWSPNLLVSSKPLFGRAIKPPEIHRNDVVYVGLDPSGWLPPLFLGVKSAAR